MRFVEAVKHYQRLLFDQEATELSAEQREHGLGSERVTEASRVSDIAHRFARAELDGRPIGRAATGRLLPPLGRYLKRQLRGSETAQSAAWGAIVQAIARTYVSSMVWEPAVESEPRLNRNPVVIWDFWIPRIYSPFLKELLAPEILAGYQDEAVQTLGTEIHRLNLGRKVRRRRFAMIGMAYGEAGVILRAAQTTQIPDAMFDSEDAVGQARWPSRWPYEDYPA